VILDPFIFSLILFTVIAAIMSLGINQLYRSTKSGFFVSNRNASTWQASFSITAAALYIFAVLITAAVAVTKGPAASFWFILPFFIVLTFIGILGNRLLTNYPTGYTFSEYIAYRYNDPKITRFYQTLHILAAVYSVTVSLTGFGKIVDFISQDLNYNIIVIGLGLSVLAYSAWGGIKSSLRTDTVLLWIILTAIITNAWLVVAEAGGIAHVYSVWSTARPGNFIDISLALDPGLLMLLLVAGSLMADNGQYQKIYALGNKRNVIKAYFLAAVLITITYIMITLIAASSFSLGILSSDPQLTAAQVIQHINGPVGVIAFTLAVLCISGTTVDCGLNSAGSLVANDILPNQNQILTSRITMMIVAFLGIGMALLKLDLWFLITTFGVFRLIAVFPTMFGLLTQRKINTNVMFYSMLAAGTIGLVAVFYKFDISKVLQSVFMLAIPGIAVMIQLAGRRA